MISPRILAVQAFVVAAYCQPAPAGVPQADFEVVSIKPAGSAVVRIPYGGGPVPSPFIAPTYSSTRFRCRLALRGIIQEAYSLQKWQLDGPSSLDAELFEVTALMPAGTTKDAARLMLRSMLAERFGMVSHRERRIVSVYALTQEAESHKLLPSRDGGGPEQRPGSFAAPAVTTQGIAVFLTGVADRPVIDETGLTGSYNVRLTWNQDFTNHEDAVADIRRERIFEAVRTQLGLKIVPRKAPLEILVIDRIQNQPAAN